MSNNLNEDSNDHIEDNDIVMNDKTRHMHEVMIDVTYQLIRHVRIPST